MNKKVIALCTAAIMAISAVPISAFASSTGSTSANTGIGEDKVQNAKTQYSEKTDSNTQTAVYLTVDDSDLIVSLPTTVIVSGTPDSSGNYTGNYSVGVKGNMSGSKQVSITPDENVTLAQKGKENKEAAITQQQTVFTTDDFKNGTVTNGAITAQGLTAGSWNGQFNFNISYSTPIVLPALADCAKTALVNNKYTRSENQRYLISKSYFLIPVTPGATISVSNNNKDNNILFSADVIRNWDYDIGKSSGWLSSGQSSSYEVPNNGVYLYLYFKHSDESAISADEINLEDYIVTSSDTGENLINKIPGMVYAYNHAHLKNYDAKSLSDCVNQNTLIAHAAGSETFKDTIEALNSVIADGKFTNAEFDVQLTKDKVFVLNHDNTVTGMTTLIKNSTYDDIIAVNPNVPKLSDVLTICKANNIFAYLDCKFGDITQDDVNALCNLITEAGMQSQFSFCELSDATVSKLPDEFSTISRVVYNWTAKSLTEPRDVYYSFPVNQFGAEGAYKRRLILNNTIGNIVQGCKYYSLWDSSNIANGTSSFNKEERTFTATVIYLFSQYGGVGTYCFFSYYTPDFSDITEKDIIDFVPQDVWAQTNVIEFE